MSILKTFQQTLGGTIESAPDLLLAYWQQRENKAELNRQFELQQKQLEIQQIAELNKGQQIAQNIASTVQQPGFWKMAAAVVLGVGAIGFALRLALK